jgi:menaquinone-9 beta-reductase
MTHPPVDSPTMAEPAVARSGGDEYSADVIIVGAGPGGSTTAAYLAQAGVDVLVLEKSTFPREKVCGDGLTPRAVRELLSLGVDLDQPGWIRNHGLRIVGGGRQLAVPWPELGAYPGFGLVRTRLDFDEILARHAQKVGARLQEGVAVDAPVVTDGRVTGVTARGVDESGRKIAGPGRTYRAPLVVAADGNSSRLSLAAGRARRENRPLGVAVRTYYRSPRHDIDWLESWLELWDGRPGTSNLLPGYGWLFGVGDGTVNIGVGLLNTSTAFQQVDYKDLLGRWVGNLPEEWGLQEANRTAPIRGAALPMGFNRKPHYADGLLLVGDAGGMVNPFNGEGIAYAMESGQLAAEIITQALGRRGVAGIDRALGAYPRTLEDRYGGYFTLGRVFVRAIGHPQVMRFATNHGMSRPALMRFALKLLANLTEPRGGDATDRIINGLAKIAPAA